MTDTAIRPTTSGLLRNPDWRRLWVGNAVSSFGTKATAYAYPFVALTLTGKPSDAAMVGGASLAGNVVGLLPAGSVVDRLGGRRVLVATAIVQALISTAVFLCIARSVAALPLLVAGACLQGFLGAGPGPSTASIIKEVVPREELTTARSLNEARSQAASVCSPPIGGYLLSLGLGLPFAFDAMSYAVQGYMSKKVRAGYSGTSRGNPLTALTEGWKFIFDNRALRVVVVYLFLSNCGELYLLSFITYGLAAHGASSARISIIPSAVAVASITLAVLTPRILKRFRAGYAVVAAGAICAAGPALLLAGHGTLWAAAVMALSLGVQPIISSVIFAYQADVTPQEMQGRVGSALVFCALLATPVGAWAAGFSLSRLTSTAGTLTGVAVMAIAWLPLVANHHLRSINL